MSYTITGEHEAVTVETRIPNSRRAARRGRIFFVAFCAVLFPALVILSAAHAHAQRGYCGPTPSAKAAR